MAALFPLVGSIVDLIGKFFPDKTEEEKNQLALAIAELTASSKIAESQSATNTAEASNPSLFVAGWRPFIGWTLGIAFLLMALQPTVIFTLGLFGVHAAPVIIDPILITNMLGGMLGIGGMRTYEKVKGCSGIH